MKYLVTIVGNINLIDGLDVSGLDSPICGIYGNSMNYIVFISLKIL